MPASKLPSDFCAANPTSTDTMPAEVSTLTPSLRLPWKLSSSSEKATSTTSVAMMRRTNCTCVTNLRSDRFSSLLMS